MKRYIVTTLLCLTLAGCIAPASPPPSADDKAQTQATVQTLNANPVPAVQASETPVTTPPPAGDHLAQYPNGMAQTFQDCGKPGFNSDSGLCHPTGAPTNLTTPVASQQQIDAANDELAKLGTLDASNVTPDGYPVLNLECNKAGDCFNGGGAAVGNIDEVAKMMPAIRPEDIISHSYKCMVICRNDNGEIIGRTPYTDRSPH